MALQALQCGVDGCIMPTWSNEPRGQTGAPATSSAADRPRFRDVLASAGGSTRLLRKYVKAKGARVVGKVVPGPVKRAAIRVAAKRAQA